MPASELPHLGFPPFLGTALARAPLDSHPRPGALESRASGSLRGRANDGLERLVGAAARHGARTLAIRRTDAGGALVLGGLTAWHLPARAPLRWLDAVREAADVPRTGAPQLTAFVAGGQRVHVDLAPTFDGEKATLVLPPLAGGAPEESPDEDVAELLLEVLRSLHGRVLTPEDALVLGVAARTAPATFLLPRLADQVLLALGSGNERASSWLGELARLLLRPAVSPRQLAARAEPVAELLRFASTPRCQPANASAASAVARDVLARHEASWGQSPGLRGIVTALLPPAACPLPA